MNDSNAKEKTCPLCGGDNQCAVAAGRPPESCWCQQASISSEALAAVPADAVDKYCLCPACGQVKEGTTVEG
jgi:hypothetical protein